MGSMVSSIFPLRFKELATITPSAAGISSAILFQLRPTTNKNRSILAAALANSKSSLVGGLPVAQPERITASAKPLSMVSCTAIVKLG